VPDESPPAPIPLDAPACFLRGVRGFYAGLNHDCDPFLDGFRLVVRVIGAVEGEPRGGRGFRSSCYCYSCYFCYR